MSTLCRALGFFPTEKEVRKLRIIFQLSNDCVKLKVSFQVNQDQGFYEGIKGPACIDSWKFLNIVEDHKIHKVSESVRDPENFGPNGDRGYDLHKGHKCNTDLWGFEVLVKFWRSGAAEVKYSSQCILDPTRQTLLGLSCSLSFFSKHSSNWIQSIQYNVACILQCKYIPPDRGHVEWDAVCQLCSHRPATNRGEVQSFINWLSKQHISNSLLLLGSENK